MRGDSYSHGRLTGASDGSAAGDAGAEVYKSGQRNLERNKQLLQNQQATMAGIARVHDESRKLGDHIMTIVAALFLHPYFCFVGFWLVCFGLLLALAPQLGLSNADLDDLPNWYVYSAMVVPVVLAVALRKFIPILMKWLFFGALAVLAILLVVEVINSR